MQFLYLKSLMTMFNILHIFHIPLQKNTLLIYMSL